MKGLTQYFKSLNLFMNNLGQIYTNREGKDATRQLLQDTISPWFQL